MLSCEILLFDCSKTEFAAISQIADRACALNPDLSRLNLEMDLATTHTRGCPLDFARLLGASDSDFLHDISGISHHLNRKSGKLKGHFIPRCAMPEAYIKKEVST